MEDEAVKISKQLSYPSERVWFRMNILGLMHVTYLSIVLLPFITDPLHFRHKERLQTYIGNLHLFQQTISFVLPNIGNLQYLPWLALLNTTFLLKYFKPTEQVPWPKKTRMCASKSWNMLTISSRSNLVSRISQHDKRNNSICTWLIFIVLI